MEAVIKLKAEELNGNLFLKLQELFEGKKDIEVTISIIEKSSKYVDDLNRSIKELNNNETVAMSLEEFLEYPLKR